MSSALTELRIAALDHAIEQYAGPDDDTLPVLRGWLRELRAVRDATEPEEQQP